MTMVERVARAIDEASEDVSLAFVPPHPLATPTALACHRSDRDKRFRQARAAIKAMREPTEYMLERASGLPVTRDLAADVWEVMCEAALAEK